MHCLYFNPGSRRAAEVAAAAAAAGLECRPLGRPGLSQLCRQADRYKEHHVHQVHSSCSVCSFSDQR